MRLIDADALIANRDIQINIGAGDNICIDVADIAKAPTIDAAPVFHARWIEFKNPCIGRYFTCSNCGKDENHHTAVKGHYCWNCGAKMDAEEV